MVRRSHRRSRWLLLALTFALCSTFERRAAAWTETTVDQIDTWVVFEDESTTRVRMALGLEVRRGWVESIDIDGMPSDLQIVGSAETPVRSLDGSQRLATLTVPRPGTVRLSFARAGAPRKGRYTLSFTYRTAAVASNADDASPRRKYAFAIPAWEKGLGLATITIDAPRGARGDDAQAARDAAQLSVRSSGGRTLLSWTRLHIPRETPWEVSFDLPIYDAHATNSGSTTASRAAPTLLNSLSRWGVFALLFLAVAAKIRGSGSAYLDLRLRARPIVPIAGASRRMMVAFALFAAAGALPADCVLAAVILSACGCLLALERAPVSSTSSSSGAWRALKSNDLPALSSSDTRSEQGLFGWLDATRPRGSFVCGLAMTTAFALARFGGESVPLSFTLAALVAPIFAWGTRKTLPPSLTELLLQLIVLRDRLREHVPAQGFRMRIVGYYDDAGHVLELRLRVTPDEPTEGLVRCDIAFGHRATFHRVASEQALVLVARAGSKAHTDIGARLGAGTVRVSAENLVAWVVETEAEARHELLSVLQFWDEEARVSRAQKPHEIEIQQQKPANDLAHRIKPLRSVRNRASASGFFSLAMRSSTAPVASKP